MRSFLLTGAALLVLSQAAMAQSPNAATQPNATQNQTSSSATAQPQHLRSNLRNALEKAGYKDIRVAPTSFMVRARDTDGNPVVMAISPDTFTEVADVGNGSNNGSAPSTTGTVNSNSSATFMAVPQADELSSKVVGLDIYNNDNKDIGQIKDIAMNPEWPVAGLYRVGRRLSRDGRALCRRQFLGREGHL